MSIFSQSLVYSVSDLMIFENTLLVINMNLAAVDGGISCLTE